MAAWETTKFWFKKKKNIFSDFSTACSVLGFIMMIIRYFLMVSMVHEGRTFAYSGGRTSSYLWNISVSCMKVKSFHRYALSLQVFCPMSYVSLYYPCMFRSVGFRQQDEEIQACISFIYITIQTQHMQFPEEKPYRKYSIPHNCQIHILPCWSIYVMCVSAVWFLPQVIFWYTQ